jgi:DNA-binding PadR family transcriptional regulator
MESSRARQPHPDEDPALSPTGRVILGVLALGKRTGYDIKQLVDKSTRHFWAASYGQIYPELRRLEELGLIRGQSEPSGARARVVFELTEAGQGALRRWLEADDEPFYELRDEGMLKLFFSDAGEPQWRIENLRAMRERHERKLAQLLAVEEKASRGPEGMYLTLQLGIGMSRWIIDWCSALELRLAADPERG